MWTDLGRNHRHAASRQTMRASCLAALLAVSSPLAAAAQTPSGPPIAVQPGAPGQLRGVVYTSDAATVSGATVTLAPSEGPSYVLVTGEDGVFAFPAAAPAGPAMLRARRIGFSAESLSVTLPAAANAPVAIRLATVPQALAPVVVKAREYRSGPLGDFDRRRANGHGRYITRADIERRNPIRTSDLLRTLPGVQLATDGVMNHVRIRSSPCAPEVFLDGTPLGPTPLDFDAIAPSSVEGIEVYSGPGTVPVEFARPFGRTACGTIILWTRRGEPRPRKQKGKPITSEDLARLVEGLQLFTAEQVDAAAQPPDDFVESVRLPDSVTVDSSTAAVIAEFVVDTAGAVEPATINIVASPGAVFANVVRTALPGKEFTPARRGGRPVRQLVQLSVRFDPNKRRR